MKSLDEGIQPRCLRLGQQGSSHGRENSNSTAAKTSEILKSHASNHLQRMEEKYLSLKYPSYATNFAVTESSNKDLLKTHQVDFGTISGWDSTAAFPHPSELYEMIKPFFQEEVRRQLETFKTQMLD